MKITQVSRTKKNPTKNEINVSNLFIKEKKIKTIRINDHRVFI